MTAPSTPAPTKDRSSYFGVINRLSKASVDKHWEAYADIPWDDPDYQIDPDDPRWTLSPFLDPLARTDWYASQPEHIQARIGLWRTATAMKVGLQFENLLKRGLLNYAYWLPNGRPEFRYVLHETTEECHHAMMFQEFVNRTKMPIRGMPRALTVIAQSAPWIPLISTELFFVFVLGGEDPIDYVQRRTLKEGYAKHPLQKKIMQIHIAEEARHISFARHFLRHRVPRLSPLRRGFLSVMTPIVLGAMARIMLCPPGPMVRYFNIPPEVVKEAYRHPDFRAELRNCIAKTRELAHELGLINPVSKRVWQALGIWDAPAGRTAARRAAQAA
ncbi:AurF N-oxygenase family protein [Thermomonospora catenispora]|uniref:AurF N-oxygenase family protein n=1 Tax=Thermomonospora catenispora TaxID=2493090 RepID=UPI00112336C5|nr:diiron oxygenase [Thermomonospora catenispora]TNY35225.1 diiron oxygenase [Thermomonospora catenispora]